MNRLDFDELHLVDDLIRVLDTHQNCIATLGTARAVSAEGWTRLLEWQSNQPRPRLQMCALEVLTDRVELAKVKKDAGRGRRSIMEVARGMNDRQADTALVYEVSALRPPELRTKSTSKPHYGGHAKQPSGAVVEWTDRRSHGDMMELQSRLLQLLGEDEVLVDLIPADDGTVADLLQLVEEAQPYEEAIKVLQKPGHGMPVIAMVSKVRSHDMMSSEASEALQQVCVGDVIKSIDGKDMIGKGVDTVRNALKGRGHLQNEHGLWSSARNGPAASIPSPLHPGKKAKQPTVTVCFKRTSLTNTKLVSELKAISLSTNETGLLTRDLLNGNNNQTQQAHQRARFMLGQVTNLLDKITQVRDFPLPFSCSFLSYFSCPSCSFCVFLLTVFPLPLLSYCRHHS
jgi:hypothetical protein